MSALFSHSQGRMIYLQTVFLFPPTVVCRSSSPPHRLPSLSLFSPHLLPDFSPSFSVSHTLFFSFPSLFPLFLITSSSLFVSFPLTLPLHFHFSTSPPLFTFSLQRGHYMNNSKVLQDDNGKLEVRLCVACMCVCKISWFIPARSQL